MKNNPWLRLKVFLDVFKEFVDSYLGDESLSTSTNLPGLNIYQRHVIFSKSKSLAICNLSMFIKTYYACFSLLKNDINTSMELDIHELSYGTIIESQNALFDFHYYSLKIFPRF